MQQKISFFIKLTLLLLVVGLFSFTASNSMASHNDVAISVDHENDNIRLMPIRGFQFVYIKTRGSLVNFLKNETEFLTRKLNSSGILPDNICIIYLDYFDIKPPATNPFSTKPPLEETMDKNPKNMESDNKKNFMFTTDENIKLDLTDLVKYTLPFLTFKREILLGSLVPSYKFVSLQSPLKSVPFDFANSFGFMHMSNEYYNKEAEDLSKARQHHSSSEHDVMPPNNKTSESPKDVAKKPSDKYSLELDKPFHGKYTNEEIIRQRISMLKFVNLAKYRNSVIGFMEYHDIKHNVYAYFALPGDVDKFLKGQMESQKSLNMVPQTNIDEIENKDDSDSTPSVEQDSTASD